jgi:hypothetical protein
MRRHAVFGAFSSPNFASFCFIAGATLTTPGASEPNECKRGARDHNRKQIESVWLERLPQFCSILSLKRCRRGIRLIAARNFLVSVIREMNRRNIIIMQNSSSIIASSVAQSGQTHPFSCFILCRFGSFVSPNNVKYNPHRVLHIFESLHFVAFRYLLRIWWQLRFLNL